jgi:proteasome lid subunit RPN8/RPN11
MSGVDVRDLAREKLPEGKFPIEPRADFRVYLAPEVRRGIEEHAEADITVEICGVLVGHWGTDENGPYAAVTDYIRCANATSKFAEVTFTHESWAQINKEMDSRFADARIIGWYHSHPDFGIFLSERDTFIQEHFFSAPGQVAYVIDPVRDLEGVFAWRNGKPTPMPHFWIGNTVRTVDASERSPGGSAGKPARAGDAESGPGIEAKSPDVSSLGLATIALGALALFVVGYLYGSTTSRWKEERLVEGAVAHFADTKLIRDGLEDQLAHERSRLNAIAGELKKLPKPGDKLSKEQLGEAEQRRALIEKNLASSEQQLTQIQDTYGLSDEERRVYLQIVTLKMAEVRRMLEEVKKPPKKLSDERGSAAGAAAASTNKPPSAPQDKSARDTQPPQQQPPATK